MIDTATRLLRRFCSRLTTACTLTFALGLLPIAIGAQELTLEDGARFEVRSAYLEPVDGVLKLNAVLDVALSRSAVQALRNGVPVVLQLELVVNRKRHYLPDRGVGHLVQRWQISYHALSEHYLVANMNSGLQTSYSSLGSALSSLADVRGLPILDEALIEKSQRYEASLRLSANIEGGLPDAVRVLMFWADWYRASEWYTWTLRT